MRARWYAAALLLLALAGCGTVARGPHPEARAAPRALPDERRIAAAESLLVAFVDPRRVPGLAVAVHLGDAPLLHFGAGVLRPGSAEVPTAQMVLPIGSISKLFTALALLRLEESGRLSLDDRAGRWIEELPAGWEGITLRHLLTHTAGVARDAPPGELPRTLAVPGTAYAYSNAGYLLLGRVVERAAGLPYATYLRESVLTPAGLVSIGECPDEPEAAGHRWSPVGLVSLLRGRPGAGEAAGGLCASAEELARVPALLARGRLLSPSSFAAMTTPGRLASGETTGYGMGLRVGEGGRYQHSGAVDGFTSHLRHDPGTGLTIVILANSETAQPAELAEALERLLLGNPSAPP